LPDASRRPTAEVAARPAAQAALLFGLISMIWFIVDAHDSAEIVSIDNESNQVT